MDDMDVTPVVLPQLPEKLIRAVLAFRQSIIINIFIIFVIFIFYFFSFAKLNLLLPSLTIHPPPLPILSILLLFLSHLILSLLHLLKILFLIMIWWVFHNQTDINYYLFRSRKEILRRWFLMNLSAPKLLFWRIFERHLLMKPESVYYFLFYFFFTYFFFY